MRRILGFVLVLSFIVVQVRADDKRIVGVDWLLMTPNEKVVYLDQAFKTMRDHGIPVSGPSAYYGSALNEVVDRPGADKADVLSLLTQLVYKKEPETRKFIDQMKKTSSLPPQASSKSAAKPGKVSI